MRFYPEAAFQVSLELSSSLLFLAISNSRDLDFILALLHTVCMSSMELLPMSMNHSPAQVLGQASPSVDIATQPFFSCRIRAGFPSPADDHLDGDINLHTHVVKHPTATFFVRSEGDSMQGDGIYDGDLLVVDRSLEPLPGRVLIVALNGELTVKRLEHIGHQPYLTASNTRYKPIPLINQEAQVWGVVTHVVHALEGGST